MDGDEQETVDRERGDAEPQEAENVDAARGEERAGADGAVTRQAVQQPAKQERRDQQLRGHHPHHRGRWAAGVGDAAQVLQDGGKAEDGGDERVAYARGLGEELVPPVEIHARGCCLRGHALAQVLADQGVQSQ